MVDIVKNKRIIIYIILAILDAGLMTFSAQTAAIFGQNNILSEIVSFLILLFLIIFEAKDMYDSKKDVDLITVHADETKKGITTIKDIVKEVQIKIDDSAKERIERFEETKPIAELINENLISLSTINKCISDKKFFVVQSYQKGFKYIKPKGYKERRKYYSIFDELNFTRIATYDNVFVISEDNIFPKKLRDKNKFSEFLLGKAKICLDLEWKGMLEYAKDNDKTWYKNHKDDKNPLNFNFILMKISRREMRHRFLISNDFNKEFNAELASITQLEKLKVEDDEMMKLKSFVLNSSLNILTLSLTENEKKNILSLEKEFKKSVKEGGLSIIHFYDYNKRNKQDVVRILKKKFNDEKSNIYADLLIENSRKYENILRKIGVNLE